MVAHKINGNDGDRCVTNMLAQLLLLFFFIGGVSVQIGVVDDCRCSCLLQVYAMFGCYFCHFFLCLRNLYH